MYECGDILKLQFFGSNSKPAESCSSVSCHIPIFNKSKITRPWHSWYSFCGLQASYELIISTMGHVQTSCVVNLFFLSCRMLKRLRMSKVVMMQSKSWRRLWNTLKTQQSLLVWVASCQRYELFAPLPPSSMFNLFFATACYLHLFTLFIMARNSEMDFLLGS